MPKALGVQFPISVGNRGKYEHRMKRLRSQLPFLQSVLKEANRFKRRTPTTCQCRSSQCRERTGLEPLETKHSHHANHHESTPPSQKRAAQPGPSETFLKKTTAVAHGSKRSWSLARSPHRPVPMSSTVKLSTWASLLQDANRARDRWKESCQYWQHKYETLYQTHMHTLKNLLCDACRASPDQQELCDGCSARWKKFT